MNYIVTFIGIAVLIWFVFMLQKWRKIIIKSVSPFDSAQTTRKNNAKAFLIDAFSLGIIGFIVTAILLTFGVIKW